MDGTGKNVKMKRRACKLEKGGGSELRRKSPWPFLKVERQPTQGKLHAVRLLSPRV